MIQGPPAELVLKYMPIYQDFYWRLGVLYRQSGAQLTSLYRDPARNRRVGGHERSQHLLGLAADFSVAKDQVFDFLRLATWLGLIAIDEGSHVHVQRYKAGVIPARIFPGE